MNIPPQDQVTFWQSMAEGLNAGTTLLDCLRQAQAAAANPQMREVVASLARAVQDGKTLSQAMAEHPQAFAEQAVAAVAAGETGGVVQAVASQIARALQAKEPIDKACELAPDPRAVEYVSQLLGKALKERAGDLHFDQLEGKGGLVRMRIDGVLHEVPPPPKGLMGKVIDYLKAMGAMDTAERRLPQDGQCLTKEYKLFLSTVPAFYGERAVVRILTLGSEGVLLGLDRLGLAPEDLQKVRRLAHLPGGLVIANGPAGEGKTTLLYSMLMEIDRTAKCILTAEDPVELAFAGMGQIQIRPQIGLTFARAIRSMLRQATEVIMVGEIRDPEVAQLCVQSSLTGHLVLTTLHANTGPGAIQRLLDMGLKPFMVSSCLAGVISPRLVRVLCPHCRQEADPPLHSLPPEAVAFVKARPDARFYQPKGCEQCGAGRGYRGRTALFEVLVMDDRLRQMVTDGADLAAVRAAAVESGMRTLMIDGLDKAAQGVTSIQEVLRVFPVTP